MSVQVEAQTDAAGGDLAAAPPKKFRAPVATMILLAILIAIFCIETLPAERVNENQNLLTILGGLNRRFVLENGQWYRMVTATFLHGNFFHILMNGIVLFFAGMLVENRLGKAWFLAVYTVSGLTGSCFSLALNAPNTNSVGASGAIMGLLAGAFVLTFRDPKGDARLKARIALLRLLIPAFFPRSAQHIDIAAHLGGAIGGGATAAIILWVWERGTIAPPYPRLAKAIPLLALPFLPIGLRSGFAVHEIFVGLAAENSQRFDDADRALTRAIELDSTLEDGFSERAIVRFALKRYRESAADFRVIEDRKPNWAYAPLILHIARAHARETDREELAENAKAVDLTVWPGPALALFLGRTEPDMVVHTAARAEQQTHEHQSCEAPFYIGEWHLLRGETDQGRSLIDMALKSCPADFIEHKLAKAELGQ